MALTPFTGELDAPATTALKPFTGELDAPAAPPPVSWGDTIAGLPVTRLAMGAASPLIGIAQLGAHVGDAINEATGVKPVVSPWIDQQIARYHAAKTRGMKAAGDEGFDWMGLLGSAVPTTAMASGMNAAMPVAKTLGGKMLSGMVQGGVAGASQPVEQTEEGFWSPKGLQATYGASVGATMPVVSAAIEGVGKLAHQARQPFTETGRAEILKSFRDAIMGQDPVAKARMIQAAANAKPGVGGVQPTLGEVLSDIPESTGLAAHQQDVARLPGVSTEFQQRAAEQAGARVGELGSIAKTPTALEQAIQSRSSEAASKYGIAAQDVVTHDAPLKALLARPSMQKAVSRAVELSKESGQPFDPTSVQSLHYVKMAMDDLIKNPERFSIGAKEAQAMGKTQGEFVHWLGDKSPAYNIARESYKTASGPINRMQIGQELEKALTTPLGTSERSGMFAKAVEDAPRTIKRATGQQMFQHLDEVLKPDEVQSVKAVAEELAKNDAFNRLARGTKISGKDAIPGDIGLPLPNLLYRPTMIANFMMKHFAKDAEDKIAKVAAQQYLNPPAFAKAMAEIPPRYKPMIDALMQQVPAAAGTMTGRAIGGSP